MDTKPITAMYSGITNQFISSVTSRPELLGGISGFVLGISSVWAVDRYSDKKDFQNWSKYLIGSGVITLTIAGTVLVSLASKINTKAAVFFAALSSGVILGIRLQEYYSKNSESDFKGWNQFTIAEHLWQDGHCRISEEMVQKVNNAHAYLKKIGFKLQGAKADGNCFFNAFLENYKVLTREIPLLDKEENKISYLRQQVAAQYESSPNNSKYPDRSEQIKEDAAWVIASGEGDLLANIFDIPIRVLTVGTESVMDLLTFSQYNTDREEWNKIHETARPQEYIFIIDLGGHFIHAVPDFPAKPWYHFLIGKGVLRNPLGSPRHANLSLSESKARCSFF